jgi:hypothetical protein
MFLAIIYLLILFIPLDQLIYSFAGSIDLVKAMESLYLLMQIESTVFAIIISLSLVAVQLASSSFTSRVIEIFRKDKIFWSIVTFYIILTIYGIIILTLYNLKHLWGLQNWIFFYFILGIIAFLSVIPFIYNTLNILKPITLIKKLSKDITKEKIILNIDDENTYEDPIQPLIDILQSSVMRYDYRTLKDCLVAIEGRVTNILRSELSEDDRKKINRYLLNHFKRISNLAINQKDQESLKEIIDTVIKNSEIFNDRWIYNEEIFEETVEFFKEIEKLIMDQQLENSLIYLSNFSCQFGKIAFNNNNYEYVQKIILSLQNNIDAAIDKNMDWAAIKAADSLVQVEKFKIDRYDDILDPILSLKKLFDSIIIAINKSNEVLALKLFEEHCKLAKYGIENQSAAIMGFTPYYIKELRNHALKQDLIGTSSYAGECLVSVFNSYMAFTERHSIENVLNFIKIIGENAIEESDNTKEMLILSLKKIIKNMGINAQIRSLEIGFYSISIDELNNIANNLVSSLTDLSPFYIPSK